MRRAPNEYRIDGDTAVLLLRRRGGPTVECFIDTTDLQKALSLGRAWCFSRGRVVCFVGPASQRRPVFLHRFLTDAPQGMDVDHGDGDSLNNRRSTNLTIRTHAKNLLNRPRPYKGRVMPRGVKLDKRTGRYTARVKLNRKEIYLGSFETAERASTAVQAFVRQQLTEAA